jgi:hypothetical protein
MSDVPDSDYYHSKPTGQFERVAKLFLAWEDADGKAERALRRYAAFSHS